MLRDTAIADIQKALGFRTDQQDNCVAALQTAQRLLERGRTLPYFLLEESAEIELVADTGSYALPERFLREDDDLGIWMMDLTPSTRYAYRLEKLEGDVVAATFPDPSTDTGTPNSYRLMKASLWVFPVPDTARTLSWSYYKGAVSLATNVENEWLEEEYGAPEVLIARAGMIVAEDLFNQPAYEKFQKRFLEAYAGMLGDTIQRQEANKPLYMGGRL